MNPVGKPVTLNVFSALGCPASGLRPVIDYGSVFNLSAKLRFSRLYRPLSPIKVSKAHKWALPTLCSLKAQRRDTVYRKVGKCLVFPTMARRHKPKAIINLLGGAFIGAIPEMTYSLFIELLTKEGFLVVATPYNVTFKHAVAAEEVHHKFRDCLSILLDSGFSPSGLSSADMLNLPVFCVGHSNGALLQLLIGSLFQDNLPKANAVIAFNNKPAAVAVPYFEQFSPLMVQFPSNLGLPIFLDLMKSFPGDPAKALLDASLPLLPGYDEESFLSIQRFMEQIPSVFDQITQGVSEFKPSPTENRGIIGSSYSIKDTLLVKFTVDAIDESDIIEETLRPRIQEINGCLSKLVVKGNHITPCSQDVRWEVGTSYTPADAIGQLLKNAVLSDIRQATKDVTDWFDSLM